MKLEVTTTTLHVMSFEQWKKRNEDLLDEVEDCHVCDGEGTHVCDCGDEHECGLCFGSGKKNGATLRTFYEQQKSKDMAKLEAWSAKGANA